MLFAELLTVLAPCSWKAMQLKKISEVVPKAMQSEQTVKVVPKAMTQKFGGMALRNGMTVRGLILTCCMRSVVSSVEHMWHLKKIDSSKSSIHHEIITAAAHAHTFL